MERRSRFQSFGLTEAVPKLLKGLRNKDAFQRWEAVKALGSIYNHRTDPALISVLKGDSPDLRREAALSLGRIGSNNVETALLKAAEQDEDPQVRWRAALANINKAVLLKYQAVEGTFSDQHAS